MRPKIVTKTTIADELMAFYDIHHRAPLSSEIRNYIVAVAIREYGSWENTVRSILNLKSANHHWTREEVVKILGDKRAHVNRLPCGGDFDKSVLRAINRQYGTFEAAIEAAFGINPHTAILDAVDQLTPSCCSDCSADEIAAKLGPSVPLTVRQIGQYCRVLGALGYLSSERTGRITLYSLTAAGRRHHRSNHAENHNPGIHAGEEDN